MSVARIGLSPACQKRYPFRVNEDGFGIPAGWYPDPLGLPQLRWWDSQAWTEHTSDARAPIVVQPATRLAFADEELPSRREQRDRERRENSPEHEARSPFDRLSDLEYEYETDPDVVREELSAQPLLAMTLKELEPPVADTEDQATSGPLRARQHANSRPGASTLTELDGEAPPERAPKRQKTFTAAAWAIALMPLLQLAASVFIVVVLELGANLPLLVVVWAVPYLAVLGFAAYDKLLLQTWGHSRPASALWATLTSPTYLVVRAVRTHRETGKGSSLIAVWGAGVTALFVAVLVVPGLVISLAPQVFSAEVERTVEANATALGGDISVDCPSTPPLLIGETFTCRATKQNGEMDSILVSLERSNGWINWQVEYWGAWVMLS